MNILEDFCFFFQFIINVYARTHFLKFYYIYNTRMLIMKYFISNKYNWLIFKTLLSESETFNKEYNFEIKVLK